MLQSPRTPPQERKSNIYVFVELASIIQRLELESKMTNHTLANQAVYFHLINPKHLSASLAPYWLAILDFVGFDSQAWSSKVGMTQAQIWKKVSQFTPADRKKLRAMLHDLMARLDAELQ